MPNFGENTSNPNPLGGANCVRKRDWDITFELVNPGGGLPALLKVKGSGQEQRYCSSNNLPSPRAILTFPAGGQCNAPLDIINDFALCPDLDDPEKAGPAVTKMALETLREYKRRNPLFDVCSEGCMAGATISVTCFDIIGPCRNDGPFGQDTSECDYLGPIDKAYKITSQVSLDIGENPPFGFIPLDWCSYPNFDPYDCDYAEFVAKEILKLRIELGIEAILLTVIDNAIAGNPGSSFTFTDINGIKSLRFNINQFKSLYRLLKDPRVLEVGGRLERALARAYEKYLECLKGTLN